LLVAAGVAVGSGANFSASSANPTNTFSAGSLSIGNTSASAILSASDMKPGGSTSGTVDIKNTGSGDGSFSLSESNVADVGTPSLSALLQLTVVDCGPTASANCATGSQVYSGALNALSSTSLGTYSKNDQRRYQFTVAFPSGTAAHDNPYQGTSTSVEFDWSAVSS
jgi:hypothetical protein